jgi:ribonuclease P protein component
MQSVQLKPLKGYKAFNKVFDDAKKFHSDNLFLAVNYPPKRNKQEQTDSIPRSNEVFYGVSIAKKTAKSAVVRNRIKRLLRVSIFEIFKDYPFEDDFCPFVNIILIWKKAPAHAKLINLKDVLPRVRIALDNAYNYYIDYLKARYN